MFIENDNFSSFETISKIELSINLTLVKVDFDSNEVENIKASFKFDNPNKEASALVNLILEGV